MKALEHAITLVMVRSGTCFSGSQKCQKVFPQLLFELLFSVIDYTGRNTVSCADSALMLVSGMASGHLIKRSTHVRRYVNLCVGARGPTRSTWMISKRASGVGKDAIAAIECHWILACWHCKQDRVHCRMSALSNYILMCSVVEVN